MAEDKNVGFVMCVCTGKCPGFEKMDVWDFINRVRVELPVEYAFIHPQLCEEDGDRFWKDFIKPGRKYMVGGCAANMQYKLFRDAFGEMGLDVKKDLFPLDVRDKTTDEAFDMVEKKLSEIEGGKNE
jgi:heterodisulfide reductase subunit A-like polyferredoxin